MFFGLIPFALGFGLGSITAAPRYVPSRAAYPYPYPYPYAPYAPYPYIY